MHNRSRRFLLNAFLESEQFCWLRRREVNLVYCLGQQSGADRPNGTRGTHHHGFSGRFAAGADTDPPYFLHGIMSGPKGTGGTVAVAGGDWQRCPLGHRNTGITHDLGKRAQAHDLGAKLFRQFCRLQQPCVGEFWLVGHDLPGCATDGNQPALRFIARG